MPPIATFKDMSGYLSDDFIFNLACKKLDLTPEELEAVVGCYTKGKRVGQHRGMLLWTHCVSGGWKQDTFGTVSGEGRGHVVYPGATFDYALVDSFTRQELKWPEEVIRSRQLRQQAQWVQAHRAEYETKIAAYKKSNAAHQLIIDSPRIDEDIKDIARRDIEFNNKQIADLEAQLNWMPEKKEA